MLYKYKNKLTTGIFSPFLDHVTVGSGLALFSQLNTAFSPLSTTTSPNLSSRTGAIYVISLNSFLSCVVYKF